MIAFSLQLLQHLALVVFRLQIEKAQYLWCGVIPVNAALTRNRLVKCSAMPFAVRVIREKLIVVPESFKMRLGLRVHLCLAALGKFGRPLQSPGHGCLSQVCTAHVDRAKTAVAFKNPCLRMQPRAAAVERYAHLATR